MSIVLTSRSGPDGKLHLEIPVSQPGTEFEVEVTVRPKPAESNREHLEFLKRTAGAWQGEFERPPQLPPEERDPF